MSEDPVETRARARIGRLLRDKWKLERLLGIGGMAAVYEATHRNGSRGAIKVLHLELSLDPRMRERFLREGYVANAVDHPGAVRVLDDDRDEDGSVFLVMELLEGESLEARQRRLGGFLPAEEALLLMDQLLAVLAAAHAKNIVHRDIKPENLFLRANSELKLLDFGIARLRDGSASATRTGMTMGTPAFMAPEQALGQTSAIGPRSDLWAVGATLFTLLSGRYVHEADNPNAMMIAAATRPAPSLATVLPAAPPPLVSFVERSLAFSSDDRWPDALAMQKALRETYQALTGSPFPAERPRLAVVVAPAAGMAAGTPVANALTDGLLSSAATTPIQPPRRRVALGLAAAGVVVLGGAILAFRPSEPARTTASSAAPSVVLPSASSTASAVTTPELPARGRLRIQLQGEDCELSIDGVARGQLRTSAPHDPFELTPGEHELRCEFRGERILEQKVHIDPGETLQISLQASRASKKKTSRPAAPTEKPVAPEKPAAPEKTVAPEKPHPPVEPPPGVDPLDRRR